MRNPILFILFFAALPAFSGSESRENPEGVCAVTAVRYGSAVAAVKYAQELSATSSVESQKWVNDSEELQQVWIVYLIARNEDPRLVTTVTVETSLRSGNVCEVKKIVPGYGF